MVVKKTKKVSASKKTSKLNKISKKTVKNPKASKVIKTTQASSVVKNSSSTVKESNIISYIVIWLLIIVWIVLFSTWYFNLKKSEDLASKEPKVLSIKDLADFDDLDDITAQRASSVGEWTFSSFKIESNWNLLYSRKRDLF